VSIDTCRTGASVGHPKLEHIRVRASRLPRRSRGFTLIEIVVVVALVAGAAALTAGLLNVGLPGQQLRGSAREVAAQLRFARAQAIVSGEPQDFTLDAATREWAAPRGRHGEIPEAIEVIAVGARDGTARTDTATFRFFPDGASTGGHVRLRRGTAEWRIDIDWLTGEVELVRGGAEP
jgi:general secretion pathway protein H